MAPAGCGKTELLCEAVSAHRGRPALVLTHTHAGVAALRRRLQQKNVPQSRFRLGTLDGFALRLVGCFPARAGFALDLGADLGRQYAPARHAAARILDSGAIGGPLAASYGRVLIDEYQDCSDPQHGIALALSRHLPTCIFADELQRIFDFSGQLPAWDAEVRSHFQLVGELDRPWRWISAGAEGLGYWLLGVRDDLRAGRPIDLMGGAPRVRWWQLSGDPAADSRAQSAACMNSPADGTLMAIGGTMPGMHRAFARSCPGLAVVEAADLGDLLTFARRLSSAAASDDNVRVALRMASSVMTGVGINATEARLQVLLRGTNRQAPSAEEREAIAVAGGEGIGAVGRLLRALRGGEGRRVYRPTLYYAALRSIDRALAGDGDLIAAAVGVREALRHQGRALPRRAVGSALLLKGLESDHAVILGADDMNRKNLYVALTRAAKSVTVFSRSVVLNPRA